MYEPSKVRAVTREKPITCISVAEKALFSIKAIEANKVLVATITQIVRAIQIPNFKQPWTCALHELQKNFDWTGMYQGIVRLSNE